MQKVGVTTPRYVVRYAKPVLIGPAIYLALAAVGSYMAIVGKGHWTFWHVSVYAAVGFIFLLNVMTYSTTYSEDTVEQRVFPGIVRCFRYIDIQRVKWSSFGTTYWLLLVSIDGRRMRVYGRLDHLIEARNVLFAQIPQAFED